MFEAKNVMLLNTHHLKFYFFFPCQKDASNMSRPMYVHFYINDMEIVCICVYLL